MPTGKPTSSELKQKILEQIKYHGKTVREMHEEYGIPQKTIYNWLAGRNTGEHGGNLILENQRLRRELEEAHRIIGALTAEVSRPKGLRS